MNTKLFPLAIIATVFFIYSVAAYGKQAPQDPPKIEMDWKVGDKHAYEFDIEYKVDGKKNLASGYVAIELEKKNVEANLSGSELEAFDEGESTSTAFAVTADGYLLTCAHCVKGSRKIIINVGEKEYPAKVIDSDSELDLAIIKIEASDLPTVSLGKEKPVELAQEIRAIGYPLSNLLGENVKIAKGSVGGFTTIEGAKMIQIDGEVNHGNSGGPLVDETGSVVGVVNAKLRDSKKIGFAIPIKYACKMLDENDIKYRTDSGKEKLEGPTLAKRVTPSVLFVETEVGPGGHTDIAPNLKFSTKGSIKRTENGKISHAITQDDLILSLDGTLVDLSGDEVHLPLRLGPISQIAFETMPAQPTEKWSKVERFLMMLPKSKPKTERSGFDPFAGLPGMPRGFGGRFGGLVPRGFGPRGFRGRSPFGFGAGAEQAKPDMRPTVAESTTTYEIVKQKANLVTIKCTEEFKSKDEANDYCKIRTNTNSTLVFDRTLGVFVSKELTGSTKVMMGDAQVTIPIKLTYKRVELDKSLSKPTETTDVAVGLSDEQFDFLANSDPAHTDSRELLRILNRLADWKSEDGSKQKSVVESLARIASSDVKEFHKPAIEALLKWEPSAATAFVIAAFKDANLFSKKSWIIRLGRTKDSRAAMLLCEQLANVRMSQSAKLALINLGIAGESAVIDTLTKSIDADESQKDVAFRCVEILGEVGSKDSVKLLETIAGENKWAIRNPAERALTKIRQRSN